MDLRKFHKKLLCLFFILVNLFAHARPTSTIILTLGSAIDPDVEYPKTATAENVQFLFDEMNRVFPATHPLPVRRKIVVKNRLREPIRFGKRRVIDLDDNSYEKNSNIFQQIYLEYVKLSRLAKLLNRMEQLRK